MSYPSKAPLDTPQVAVVTVSYGSEVVLRPFLASIPAASTESVLVVVADNKPSIECPSVASIAHDAGAKYLAMPSNKGYGHAINSAVKSLPVEVAWVVISNPDVLIHPGAIDTLVNVLRSDPTIAAVGPRIVSAQGDIYPSARKIPSLSSGVGHALFSSVWPQNPWTRSYRREAGAQPLRRDAGWLSGAFLVARRSVFTELQGFDEEFFMYFEDVDLGYRIGRLGMRNVYEPAAVVTHTGAHSTSIEAMDMLMAHHHSAKRFLRKQYSSPLLWPVRALLSLGLDVRSWLIEKRGRP